MSFKRGIFVLAGHGTGRGTLGSHWSVFVGVELVDVRYWISLRCHKAGYKVALIGRDRGDGSLHEGAKALEAGGGEAAAFSLKNYDHDSIHDVFESIKKQWPDESIRVTLWNAGYGAFKGFLDATPEDWEQNVQTNVIGPAAFARESILAFKKETNLTPEGARGVLLFTGATASIRGNKFTSCFATGKHAVRALAQSLAKEFGKENIHVAHAIIDGLILTERSTQTRGEEWAKNPDVRLDPDAIAKSYLYLAHQDRSAWTWELDLRPAHENW